MPPKYKVCFICGREFGSMSLDIHQKQCMIKREKEQALLPPHMRTALNPPAQGASMTNEQAFDSWKQSLAACNMCGRTFMPDRLMVHQRSCKGDSKRVSSSTLPPPSSYEPEGNYSPQQQSRIPAPSSSSRTRPPSGSFGKTTPLGNNNNNGYSNNSSGSNNSGFGNGGMGGNGGFGNNGFGNNGGSGGGGGMSSSMGGRSSGGMNNNSMNNNSGMGNRSNMGSGGFDSGFGYNDDPPTSQMSKTSISSNPKSTSSASSSSTTTTTKRPTSISNAKGSSSSSSNLNSTSPSSSSSNRSAPPPKTSSGPSGRGVPFAVDQGNLVACRTCGRTFNEDRIEKHENICQDVSNQNRKKFDSAKARIQGTEMESVKVKPSSKKAAAKSGGKWRQQHAEFMNAVKQARLITQIQKEGGDLSLLPPPPPSLNPDYVQCPHCNRRFNETAADRHIPKCKTTVNKPKPPPTSIPPRQVASKSNPSTRSPVQARAATSSSASSNYNQTNYNSSNYATSSSSSGSGQSTKPTSATNRQSTTSTSRSGSGPSTSSTSRTSAAGGQSTRSAQATGGRTSMTSSSQAAAKKGGNFCGQCGMKYETERMRFCGECGQPR